MNSIKIFSFATLLAFVAVLGGCGSGSESDQRMSDQSSANPKQAVTDWLKSVEELGQLDSSAQDMEKNFEQLARNDVDLTEDFEKLEKANSESAVRSQARKMLEKLE